MPTWDRMAGKARRKKFMMKETPAKVMGLLGTAVVSMAFLFAVTVTDASFAGTPKAVPDPFGPSAVTSVIDQAAGSYSQFLSAYLFQPAQSDLAYFAGSWQDNVAWVIDNADQSIIAMTGLERLAQLPPSPQVTRSGSVAGAYTMHVVP